MQDIESFKLLKNKLISLKDNNKFYKSLYSDINLLALDNISDLKKIIPIINKELVFNKQNIFELIDISDGLISPSAGTTSNSFSFRHELNSTDNTNFNQLLFYLLNLWFEILNKKTLIINAYPIGISLPKGNYTLINTATREDIIFFAFDYFSEKFDKIILIAQPHFLKYVIDKDFSNLFKKNREKINFLLGGNWFPYTFETYILTKLFGKNIEGYENKIKSTMGTAESGLGVLVDFKDNLRKKISKNKLDEIIPLIYQYQENRFFIEEINGEMVLSTLQDSNPNLIRYNTQDKIEIINESNINNNLKSFYQTNMIFMHGRGDKFIEKSKISHNLYFDFEISNLISGNYYLDQKNNLNIQLNYNVENSSILKEKISNLFSDEYNISIFDSEIYPYKKSLDRKP